MVISDSVLQHAILITLLCPGTWHALQILANHQKWMRMTSDAHTSLELGPSQKNSASYSGCSKDLRSEHLQACARNSISFHVVFAFLLIELTFLFGSCILVLLVFRDQVIHVALCLGELHLVHSFTSVPVEEGLAAEHGCEVLSDAFEHLLDRSGVAQKGYRRFQALWWDIANARLNVVRNPFHEVGTVLVLHIEHLLIHLLGRHASTEQRCCCQVAAMPWVCGTHHVLRVEHLLGQLWHRQGTILLGASGCEWREANHEEVETWEWNQIHCKLTEISVQLTRKPQARRNTAHGRANKVVQITIGWRGQLQGPETNIIQSLIVQKHAFICILHQLMEGQHCVVRFHNCIRDFW